MPSAADLTDIAYSTDGPIAWITFNRPRYKNAQSWRLLDEFEFVGIVGLLFRGRALV